MGLANQKSKAVASPSSNWHALQKNLPVASEKTPTSAFAARKKRKLEHTSDPPESASTPRSAPSDASFPRGHEPEPPAPLTNDDKNGESLSALRRMIAGELEYSSAQQQPGKYLALDCEMVGVGPEGVESSLARVSIVNFHGAVQLDVFVRQRERVVDYRTQYSGVRASDMVHAKPFAEVQAEVAELLKGRILVGHAVHNDLKVLLLSHPRQLVRDTQVCAHKHKVTHTRHPALRHLVQQELGVAIQQGEHSSVTDARATMAVFRAHRREWEKGARPDVHVKGARKRKASEAESSDPTTFPGGGRKGVSSGLSTVVRRSGAHEHTGAKEKGKWWKELGGGSKGSVRLKAAG